MRWILRAAFWFAYFTLLPKLLPYLIARLLLCGSY